MDIDGARPVTRTGLADKIAAMQTVIPEVEATGLADVLIVAAEFAGSARLVDMLPAGNSTGFLATAHVDAWPGSHRFRPGESHEPRRKRIGRSTTDWHYARPLRARMREVIFRSAAPHASRSISDTIAS